MFADADHEVIDSPEALFRHLHEEHGIEEARDLDPDTAPLQFWLRRHTELERAQQAARRDPDPGPDPAARPQPSARGRPTSGQPPEARAEPRPQPESRPQARPGPRPVRFGDPMLEAMTRALVGRGHDEAAVRSAIRSFPAADGAPAGEAGVRAVFAEPMLRSLADHLLKAGAARSPASRPQPPPATAARDPGRTPTATSAPDPAVPPEAAWAVLWADLAETGRRRAGEQEAGEGDGDDLMAVADAVQQRRRVRLLRR